VVFLVVVVNFPFRTEIFLKHFPITLRCLSDDETFFDIRDTRPFCWSFREHVFPWYNGKKLRYVVRSKLMASTQGISCVRERVHNHCPHVELNEILVSWLVPKTSPYSEGLQRWHWKQFYVVLSRFIVLSTTSCL
jgi:hypothetical protein